MAKYTRAVFRKMILIHECYSTVYWIFNSRSSYNKLSDNSYNITLNSWD